MAQATIHAQAATFAVDSAPISPEERARRLRGRNLATLAGLIGLVVLFYAVTVVRVGGL